jgi:hypothetical protein
MKPAHLDRLLRLIRTHGERVVITDPETNDLMVLMHLDEYERLTGVSSEDDEDEDVGDDEFDEEMFGEDADADEEPFDIAPAWNKKVFNPPAPVRSAAPLPRFVPVPEPEFVPLPSQLQFNEPDWHIDNEEEASPELIPTDEPGPVAEKPAEEEEEKFYLEPVE